MTLRAMNWRGEPVDPDVLMRRYGVHIHPAGPGPAMRVVLLTERFGLAEVEANVPAGNLVRMVIPSGEEVHPTANGRFGIRANTEDATYYPKQGQSGLFGFSVAGQPSDYIDGLGFAFGQYDGELGLAPDGQSQANNYGHLVPTFAWVEAGSAPATPTTPPILSNELLTLTPEEAFKLRTAASAIDTIVQAAVNRRPA